MFSSLKDGTRDKAYINNYTLGADVSELLNGVNEKEVNVLFTNDLYIEL